MGLGALNLWNLTLSQVDSIRIEFKIIGYTAGVTENCDITFCDWSVRSEVFFVSRIVYVKERRNRREERDFSQHGRVDLTEVQN